MGIEDLGTLAGAGSGLGMLPSIGSLFGGTNVSQSNQQTQI